LAGSPVSSTSEVRSSLQSRPSRLTRMEKARNPRRAMTRLVMYLKPFRLSVILVVGFVLLYSLLGLGGPYLMGIAIDKFIGGKDLAGLLRIAVLMLTVYVLSNAFQVAANWIMARVSQRALKTVRADLFSHIQTLSMSFFDTHAAGGLMSRLTNDIDAINQAVSQNVTSLVASVISMLGILITMFVLNHWLALASVLVVPIMLWFTRFVAKYTRKGFRTLQNGLGELNSIAEEAISGQKVIKAFRRNESVIKAFRAKNQAVFEAGVYANSYALLLFPLTSVDGLRCRASSAWVPSPPSSTTARTSPPRFANWPTFTTRFRRHLPARSAYSKSSIPLRRFRTRRMPFRFRQCGVT